MTEADMLHLGFQQFSVDPACQASINRYLDILGSRDEATRRHSIRVGFRAAQLALVAGEPNITPQMMFWAGLLHDVGKLLVDPELLRKTDGFNEADMAQMESHVEYGWRMLRGVHPFTASVIVRHHEFGPHPYPAELPPLPEFLESQRPIIDRAGRLLALVDFYDALMSRNNDKFDGKPPAKTKRTIFLEANDDELALILRLEQAGVLSFDELAA